MTKIHIFLLLALLPVVCTLCGGNHHGHPGNTERGTSDERFEPKQETVTDTFPPDSLAGLDYLLGRFNPATHPLFVIIGSSHTTLTDAYLRRETVEAFGKMQKAAYREGIQLTIVSATRNFDAQKTIWEAKWEGKRKVEGMDLTTVKDPFERARIILKYSSMPGTSRHHWGTDIDINSVEPDYFLKDKGARELAWLMEHAADYGFCQTYTRKDTLRRSTGYEEEAWHWSYIPVASQLLHRYLRTVKYSDIRGFKGDQTAEQLHIIRDYVAGINPRCR